MTKLFSTTPNQIVQAAKESTKKDVVVPKKVSTIKMNQCPIVSDCLHRQTKCGKCVNQDQYDWDYTQMI